MTTIPMAYKHFEQEKILEINISGFISVFSKNTNDNLILYEGHYHGI